MSDGRAGCTTAKRRMGSFGGSHVPAAVVGVLVKSQLMLTLELIVKRARGAFEERAKLVPEGGVG